jgi:peptide/nickel transport system substrate-binding protein
VSGMRRWRWLAAVALLIIAVAGGALLRADGDSGRHGIGIREGGTVRVAALFEPSGFNPNTSEDSGPGLQDVAVTVYPSVFRIHPDFSVQLDPTFMVSAELTSHEPHTITYRIQPEARWSDGTPITADDFRYLWQHLNGTNPKTDAYTITGYEQIKEVIGSADGKTVTVVFSTPFAEWQGLFTNLLPAHYLRRQPGGWNRGLAKHPEDIPSGGPFRIAGFTPGETVTLARNDSYWGPKAHLDAIQFRLVPDSDAQVDALRNREADLIRPQATTDLINTVKRLPGVQSQVRTSLGFEHLTFNLKHPILAEPAVRQAIATAIDTRQLVDRLLVPVNPDAQVLGNRIWLAGQQPYQDHTGGYAKGNTSAAKQLLERAGWTLGDDGIYSKNGRRLRLRLATFTGDPRRRAEGVLLQAQLAEAGIQLNLFNTANNILYGVWLPEGNFDIADFASIGGPFALSGNQDTYRPGGSGNYARFTDPTVNALFQQAIAELEPARAAALGNQIDQRLWDQLPSIPLYQLQAFLAWRQDLLNVGNNPTTEGPFWNAGTWAFAKP